MEQPKQQPSLKSYVSSPYMIRKSRNRSNNNNNNKNYTSKAFPEEERYEIYHRIKTYPSVQRFAMKRGRNSTKTVLLYHTGLTYFEKFLQQRYNLNIEAVVAKLHKNELDVYTLIEDYVTFMLQQLSKSPNTTNQTLRAITSFLRSERISLDTKLAGEVACVPKMYKDSEYALDKVMVSKILQSAKIRRLRAFLFCLASSGCRIGELSSVRWKDIDFNNTRPTSIHLRPEYTKTKTGRVVYISDEATEELNQWRLFKERCLNNNKKKNDESRALLLPRRYIIESDGLVFETRGKNGYGHGHSSPKGVAYAMHKYFASHLESIGLHVVKEKTSNPNNNDDDENKKKSYERHTITLHSFRRFFKSAVSLEAKEPDLSEFLLGHKSLSQTYFRVSPANIAKTYLERCMEHLTFCDIASVERAKEELNQKLIEERAAKNRELGELKKRMMMYEEREKKREEFEERFSVLQQEIDKIRTEMIQKMDEEDAKDELTGEGEEDKEMSVRV
jgi:integrase